MQTDRVGYCHIAPLRRSGRTPTELPHREAFPQPNTNLADHKRMSSNYDDSSSSALTALAAAASIARSDASSAGTPRQDSDNSSISSNTTKYDFTSSNDDASANGPIITKAKSGNISNDESAKTIGSLLTKANAKSNHGSQKRKSQNYLSCESDNDDDDESEDFLISRIPKPKRPMTAYNFFFQAERKKIIREEKEASQSVKHSSSSRSSRSKASNHQASFENMGKLIGRRWKEIGKEDLKRYQALGAKESRRYKRDMKVYNAKVANLRAKKANKKMKYRADVTTAASSANAITDTNTCTTASSPSTTSTTIGKTSNIHGDALTSFINSLSQDQIKKLLQIRELEGTLSAKSGQSPLQFQLPPAPHPDSVLAQSIGQLQSTVPYLAPPASSSQPQSIGPMERALINTQGQMIAQLQAQVQALQREQMSQTSHPLPLLYHHHHQQQQQHRSQMLLNNVTSNAPLQQPMRNDVSRLTAAALSSRHNGTGQPAAAQQASPFSGKAASGNNATNTPLFFGL